MARKLDIARGKRFLDFPRRNRRVEALVQRQLGQPHRIVRGRNRPRRVNALGQAYRRRQREAGGDPK